MRKYIIIYLMMFIVLMLVSTINGQILCEGNTRVCYNNAQIPAYIQSYVYTISFDIKDDNNKGVQLYLNDLNNGVIDINGESVKYIAEYIVTRPEWIGDRTAEEVSCEILFHWLNAKFGIDVDKNRINAVNPVHIEYYKDGLNWWERIVYPPFCICENIVGNIADLIASI